MESGNQQDVEAATISQDQPAAPKIFAEIASSFTYASYQNAVPVLRSISVENHSERQFEKLRLELTSTPAFLRQKTWTIDRIVPGDRLPLGDRKIELDAAYLDGLNEAERGEIILRLFAGSELLDEHRHSVRLLARDEWGGVADMAQLLPAFVMPNDPATASLLKKAAERLTAHGHSSALDGYQSGDPKRAFMLTAAIYSAVASWGIHYAEPPASFESRGQKIRRPRTIEDQRLATCLDTTLLFAAALEAAGLHPVVLMFQGHSAVGVWLVKRTFGRAIEPDQMEVRKALASRELLVFETTGVTHRPAMTIESAQRALDPRLAEEAAPAFVAAIDISRARSGGITPLASHEPMRRSLPEDKGQPVSDLPLPAPPSFGEMPREIAEEKPTTAAGRIDRWQKKLLDLTLRNRLLNFPASKKTIPFLCTDVADLEDRLAAGNAIRLISLPEQNPLGQRDAELYRDVHGRDIQRSFAAEALRRDELTSPLDAKELESRLIDLHRQVRNDYAEGGANTLFLAVGFLRWKKKPEDEKSYRAPLLLVPVRLERRSATSNFAMRFHEDEPRFNATLLQFLERDFDLKLTQFAGPLPSDENGTDVPALLSAMRHAVRDVPGMEVVDETALSTFSFAKFLMWKDLVERTNALRENRVVRHLIDTPEKAFSQAEGSLAFCEENELDRAYAPADIVSLLPADSSQTAASLAAAEGMDFVIVGPPGTGKSQTIANMIANCLAKGRTVLFVAEKTAALDVVYRRLREHGLGNQCVELHSNKADRKHFLGQLKSSWEHGRGLDSSEWVSINERLRLHRDQLNAYVQALHKRYPNGWTPYLALGIAIKGGDKAAPMLLWPERDAHDGATLRALQDMAGELGRVFVSVAHDPALDLVDIDDWSSGWQEALVRAAQSLGDAGKRVGKAAAAYLECLGQTPIDPIPSDKLAAFSALATIIDRSSGVDISVAFDRDFPQFQGAFQELRRAIDTYKEAEGNLAASYPESAVRDIDAEGLEHQWREAEASFWLTKILGRRKVRRLLQGYAIRGSADPARDLPLLRQMKACLAGMDNTLLSGKALPIQGLSTDVTAIAQILELAAALRDALRIPGQSAEEFRPMLRAIVPCANGNPEDSLRQVGRRLLAEMQEMRVATRTFSEISGRELDSQLGPQDIVQKMARIVEARTLLREWSTWCATRRRALHNGLGPLVDALENGTLPPHETEQAFCLGYARWWLPKVLDDDPILRTFRRFRHEHAIKEFREIDDLVRKHATRQVIKAVAHGLPSVTGVPRNSELGLLRHQMELQRPSQSIRDMISRMPETFPKLAPCMLMSPLSIAQYLPPNQALFDVVIFDEASQITTWDAVGAIARGKQTIIVGDPKQLPPTNFFGRNEDDDDVVEYEKDLESILDEAKASGLPVRDLKWHYRSRSESLIAFSNHHYYQNRLVTFPSPAIEDRAVTLRKVPGGVYDRGKSRTNRIEAEAVVTEAVARMQRWLKLKEDERPTLGIITFNSQQQSLIMDLLDLARRNKPELEWFFAEDRVEPTIVKNLENVQGDERDIILFSITFWKDAAGKLTMDFGALNRDGGERRLNVAVTRARQELVVFSGFTADQIDVSRTKAQAIQDLKTFLDFAERGAIALPAIDRGSVGDFDSPFEEAVAFELERRGWMVVPQVGISGFRIDLGIKHPDLAGTYLAGIECDGATYHRSATARDRDKVREQVLRGLGWKILRVWSTDWWFEPKAFAERLHAELQALLQQSRDIRTEEQTAAKADGAAGNEDEGGDVVPDFGASSEANGELPNHSPEAGLAGSFEPDNQKSSLVQSANSGIQPARAKGVEYRVTDLSSFKANPEQFFEFAYRDTLKSMIEAVMDTESPLPADVLAQRIARAHGWLRTGGRIRERIDLYLRGYDTTAESTGIFLWKKGCVVDFLPYRPFADEASRRGIADIPLAELAWIAQSNPDLLEMSDPARELAHLLGVERLTASSRERLEEALLRARGPKSDGKKA